MKNHIPDINKIVCLMLTIAAMLCACGKVDPPAKAPDPSARVIVLCLGGLGDNCTGPDFDAVKAGCPGVDVINIADRDAYRVDLAAWLKEHPPAPNQKLVIIAHSWGTNRAIVTAQAVKVDYLCLLDPVAWVGKTMILPAGVAACDVFYRADGHILDPVNANIIGDVDLTEKVSGDHGAMTRDPRVLSRIVERINSL